VAKKDQVTGQDVAEDQTNEAPEAVIEPTPEAPEAPVVEEAVAPEAAPEAPVVEEAVAPVADDGVYVTVTVPKAFRLAVEPNKVVDYPAGICEMLIEHAEHWYSVANGVTIYKK